MDRMDLLTVFLRRRHWGYTTAFLKRIILVQKDAMLPNHEWWEELFEFCPPLLLGKFSYFKTIVSCLFQLMHRSEETNNLYKISTNLHFN